MTQFACSHHGILIREKITTYLDGKGTSKNACFLCEQWIQSKTTDLTRRILYERVKMFYVQRNIGDFYKDFYIQQIEKLAYHRSYYKILIKHHVAEVRYKAFKSTPVNISTRSDYSKQFRFEPDGQLQNQFFEKLHLIHVRLLFRLLKKNSQCKKFLWQWWWVCSPIL